MLYVTSCAGDAGTRLLFKFMSGTHGLNEELGRHRGKEGRKECLLCDAECESVSHVLWDCTLVRSAFMLEDRFEHFQSLDSFEKSSYVLGSEAWEEYSSGLLGLIKDFVLSVWEESKVRIYGEHANVHHQNDSGDLRGVAGEDGELGCLCGMVVAYEGQMLEYVTRTPRSIRAEDIIDYYSHGLAFGKPLELWHKKTKLDGDRLVGRMQGLIMKEAQAEAPAMQPWRVPRNPPLPGTS